ncbi:MAG: FecR domain-containing protein [Spirochaetes bacterium]|nr:FecR domain-containing protein [Spirochaetota bacterium]
MSKKKSLYIIPILLIIAAAAFFFMDEFLKSKQAENQQEIRVSFVFGKVFITSPGNEKATAITGMRLNRSMNIITMGNNSRCDIQSDSGNLIRIKGNSQISLDEIFKSKHLKTEKTLITLIKGKILVKIQPLLKKGKFSIKTQTAVVGVRGTEFTVSYSEKKGAAVAVKKGKVVLKRRIKLKLKKELKPIEKEINDTTENESTVYITKGQKIRVTKQDNNKLKDKLVKLFNKEITKDDIKNIRQKRRRLNIRKRLRRMIKRRRLRYKPFVKKVTRFDRDIIEDFKGFRRLIRRKIKKRRLRLLKRLRKRRLKRLKRKYQKRIKIQKKKKHLDDDDTDKDTDDDYEEDKPKYGTLKVRLANARRAVASIIIRGRLRKRILLRRGRSVTRRFKSGTRFTITVRALGYRPYSSLIIIRSGKTIYRNIRLRKKSRRRLKPFRRKRRDREED